ncbi:hypothetical protein C8Q76DRAFT_750030 [Earliella scabrosa]|nr:hypothetical protein C8Q76DRAFT_750030 [Earliella scabrosa]
MVHSGWLIYVHANAAQWRSADARHCAAMRTDPPFTGREYCIAGISAEVSGAWSPYTATASKTAVDWLISM